ncbi:hypothetical protein [Collimonas pratensis]|uniref:hypothetical protein n=1 Tax=Collimonas pratensis TaxID=279113 RepID=UPI0014314C64|nr:hypothetical protein [Collimonas pratensis]
MSNEQAVIEAERELRVLKDEYMQCLTPVAIAVNSGAEEPSMAKLLECQQLGNAYFNAAEGQVGNSGLLGAHAHGKWVTGFAETCHSILDSYVSHMRFLRSYRDKIGDVEIEPSQYAFANMQRMVKEYLDHKRCDELKNLFVDNNLPTTGFTMPAARDEVKVTKLQRILSVIIGIVVVTAIVVLAIIFPNPTPWQQFVFRGCLAVGVAALASLVPGFLNVNASLKGWGSYFTIMAGGALAIFVLIWLSSPPALSSAQSAQIQQEPGERPVSPENGSSAR